MDIPKTNVTDTDYIRGFVQTQRQQAQVSAQTDIKIIVSPPKNFLAWLAKISHRQTPPSALTEGQPFPDHTNKE